MFLTFLKGSTCEAGEGFIFVIAKNCKAILWQSRKNFVAISVFPACHCGLDPQSRMKTKI
jgi:hypothetical protein